MSWAEVFKINENMSVPLSTTIGQLADVSNVDGSVHAKIRELRVALLASIGLRQKPRGAVQSGSFTTSSGTYVTALNISGAGRLNLIMLSTHGNPGQVKITVDGTVVVEGRTPSADRYYYPLDNFLYTRSSGTNILEELANGGSSLKGQLSFKSSLKIEVINTGTSLDTYWQYELE